ncbi:MAG: HEAT repeat domain-containing protein [bacterium]|nr:HEAT repeat domain-containing protein [bacterium]
MAPQSEAKSEKNRNSKKRLRIGVIGLGQCGGNLAREFSKLGYDAVVLNTSYSDLKSLEELPKESRLHIGLDGRSGAGKDLNLGRQSLLSSRDRILKSLEQLASTSDLFLLVGGMGGGTGSNLPTLTEIVLPLKVPTSVLVTIPTESESSLTKVNAIQAVNSLYKQNLNSVILIDNQKILELFPGVSMAEYYSKANERIIKTFDEFNNADHAYKIRSIRSFDSEDFRKVFSSRGLLIYGSANFNLNGAITEDFLLEKLKELWKGGDLFASGYDYTTSAVIAVIIYAPASVLAASSAAMFEKTNTELKKLTQGAAIYTGIYQLEEGTPTRISTMIGSMDFPDRVVNLLSQASVEGQGLADKVRRDRPSLDLGEIEGMDFFSMLGQEPLTTDVEELLESLEDEDADVRLRTVLSLQGKGSQERLHPLLMKALKDNDNRIVVEAAKILGKMGPAVPTD